MHLICASLSHSCCLSSPVRSTTLTNAPRVSSSSSPALLGVRDGGCAGVQTSLKAEEILNTSPLGPFPGDNGDERRWKRIARKTVQARLSGDIDTTSGRVEVVRRSSFTKSVVHIQQHSFKIKSKPTDFGEGKLYDTALEDRLLEDKNLDQQAQAAGVPALRSSTPDLFLLDLASKIEDSLAEDDLANDALARLREEATEAILSCHWPTNKDEAYRFTDLKFLKQANITPVTLPSENIFDPASLNLWESEGSRLVLIDGVLSRALSSLEDVPEGFFVGSVSSVPEDVLKKFVLPRLSGVAQRSQQDVFACLNGVGARDLVVIIVPPGLKVTKPLYVLYYSSQGDPARDEASFFALSNPRLLVTVGKDAELDLVEDFTGAPGSLYWSNSVCEIEIEERGRVGHSYVQEQSRHAVHIRQTYVSQVEASTYKLVEAAFGGRLSRHNLNIQQLGPGTITEMSTFLLAGQKQIHDLHSKLVLDHPRGISRQLHKCIVSDSSGHGVFDGNVRVNRLAQQTDAGQLSRNLLLAPRATVNVKPNLQIIANDVKCSHGAAISDLEEEQLFYFRARGIDVQTARSALVFSFGAEVLQKLEGDGLRKRVENLVKSSLAREGYIKRDLPVTI